MYVHQLILDQLSSLACLPMLLSQNQLPLTMLPVLLSQNWLPLTLLPMLWLSQSRMPLTWLSLDWLSQDQLSLDLSLTQHLLLELRNSIKTGLIWELASIHQSPLFRTAPKLLGRAEFRL